MQGVACRGGQEECGWVVAKFRLCRSYLSNPDGSTLGPFHLVLFISSDMGLQAARCADMDWSVER